MSTHKLLKRRPRFVFSRMKESQTNIQMVFPSKLSSKSRLAPSCLFFAINNPHFISFLDSQRLKLLSFVSVCILLLVEKSRNFFIYLLRVPTVRSHRDYINKLTALTWQKLKSAMRFILYFWKPHVSQSASIESGNYSSGLNRAGWTMCGVFAQVLFTALRASRP